MKETDHSGDQGIDGGIFLKWILHKLEVRAWNGFMWLGIERSGRYLRTL
jgi:hypothetical protein